MNRAHVLSRFSALAVALCDVLRADVAAMRQRDREIAARVPLAAKAYRRTERRTDELVTLAESVVDWMLDVQCVGYVARHDLEVWRA